jgi:hypothetical protein
MMFPVEVGSSTKPVGNGLIATICDAMPGLAMFLRERRVAGPLLAMGASLIDGWLPAVDLVLTLRSTDIVFDFY